MNQNNYLSDELQTEQNYVTEQIRVAREMTQAAQKAQAELDREIREAYIKQ